jgi:hypothetical protein
LVESLVRSLEGQRLHGEVCTDRGIPGGAVISIVEGTGERWGIFATRPRELDTTVFRWIPQAEMTLNLSVIASE